MKMLLITTDFPPKINSASMHMEALFLQLLKTGHDVDVCTQSLTKKSEHPKSNIFSVNNPFSGSSRYIFRFLSEVALPLIIYFKYSILRKKKYDVITTYAPSIFWIILILLLRRKNQKNTRKILILRDIFPDWSIEIGVLRKGWISNILNWISIKFYALHDKILVQSAFDMNNLINKGVNKNK